MSDPGKLPRIRFPRKPHPMGFRFETKIRRKSMRFDKNITRWTTASAIGLAMGLTACFNSQEAGAPAPTGVKPDASEAYLQEALALKKKPGVDYDRALQQLQAKHGIVSSTDADMVLPDGSRPAGLSKSAASGTYTVAKVH